MCDKGRTRRKSEGETSPGSMSHSSKRGWTSLACKSQAHGDRFTGQLGHRQGAQQEPVLHAFLPQRPSQVGQVWGQKACPRASTPFPVPQGLLRAWVELHKQTILKSEWLVNTQVVLHTRVYCGSSSVDFTPSLG